MYKYLLCWRYLRTRYIALASIISVTLGVATMIVVNSVMAGFTSQMQDLIHGILSDLEFRSHSINGFPDPDGMMARIRSVAGDDIASMTPTVQVPAMLSFQYGGQTVTKQVHIVGIDAATQTETSDFAKFLIHPKNRERFSFDLQEDGYWSSDRQQEKNAPNRSELNAGGWQYRRARAAAELRYRTLMRGAGDDPLAPGGEVSLATAPAAAASTSEGAPLSPATEEGVASTNEDRAIAEAPAAEVAAEEPAPVDDALPLASQPLQGPAVDPFAATRAEEEPKFDPETQQHTGVVVGIALTNFRTAENDEHFLVLPGDDVQLTFPTAGTPPRAIDDHFTIVDFYESKMSEYDSQLVFVPIDKLQQLRGMIDPGTGMTYISSIQIKLRPGVDANEVRNKLRGAFPPEMFGVYTWQEKQGALLAAVQMETAILNVLLFMIIAVAGFGILAIFFMIVVEKTRDIGILKSLGAPSGGVMGIFLSYGLSLGVVGSGAGMALGLLIVAYINEIADKLSALTGQKVFDPSIYYFYKIPTIVHPGTVCWIVLGALVIAVLASVLPARRAARLHPVEALRYE